MSRVAIQGWGAVSPAGWGAEAMLACLAAGEPVETRDLARPGWELPLRCRPVPAPATRPTFLAHPRLRRSSPVSHYTVAAAAEALAMAGGEVLGANGTLGVVFCAMSGCVNYSRRFYEEVLKDPSTASPLVFPETVFNAPASHLSAFLGSTAINYTLVGDSGTFLQGLSMAGTWLLDGRVDRCLVVAAEEMDWLTADAFRHFDRRVVCAAGAGAVCLGLGTGAVTLDAVTDGVLFRKGVPLSHSISEARAKLPAPVDGEVLVDGLGAGQRLGRAERLAWEDWSAARLSPKRVLGEALAASAAWQCVAACEAVASGRHPAARISVVGPNEQAIAARIEGR
jgi:hypothetical protein